MSIIKQVTLQKIVAHDFRYDRRTFTLKRISTVRNAKAVLSIAFLSECKFVTQPN